MRAGRGSSDGSAEPRIAHVTMRCAIASITTRTIRNTPSFAASTRSGFALCDRAAASADGELFYPVTSLEEGLAGLADLDQVPVRITDIAAGLGSAVLRRRDKFRSPCTPVVIDRLNIRHPNVEEAADAVRVGRSLERDRRLVVGGPATDVANDPAVRERDERRLALPNALGPILGAPTASRIDRATPAAVAPGSNEAGAPRSPG